MSLTLTIPLYTEERRPKERRGSLFTVRPLFFNEPSWTHEQLSRATTKLAEALRRVLDQLASESIQDLLAEWAFHPAIQEHHVRIKLQLRRQTAQFNLLVITFEALERRIGMIPLLPAISFDVLRGERVEQRANEVLAEHFLKLEREDDAFAIPPNLTAFCNSWISSIELDLEPKPRLEKPPSIELLFLGARHQPSGRQELQRVGRCLDWLFPDDLERAVLREPEVAELTRRLADADRRPLLLLGPRGAGKTAILHETVYRRVEQRASPHVAHHNVWLLSPQRLISGMSYVGQWENRLLAILNEAKEKDHTLYFDDLLGLYHAGVSASSDLNVAQVLRPFAERREVRVLAEMTPEAFRILAEKDRAFADLFHVIPVKEMTEPQARRVLVTAMRQLEARFDCVFGLDVMPTVLDLQQRYVRDIALPGKAAGFVRQLAAKHRAEGIGRQSVIGDFHDRSGLSLSFLDGEQQLARSDVTAALAKRIIGQDTALAAMAATVSIAKARMNDSGRPLATFLFLGPTGVGKTQTAKALAEYLFGNADRLVRFDMNEFLDGSAVARLVGTFREPEGLLTSSVRRQPFCVLLLDEIEKAHPAVFDLLLQVLGEARLTDARGRTVDFANAIVIMTSNLGLREAAGGFGLRPADASDAGAPYLAAVERFFRPEFVNRIDHIVPFARLEREQIGRIANQLIADLFRREGLVHRQCVLQVDPEAMRRIIDAGYHPQLGARALKRSIERQISQPVAIKLAAMEPGAPAIVNVYPAAGETIGASVEALTYVEQQQCPAARLAAEGEADFLLDAAEAFVDRIERELAELQPAGGHLRQGAITPQQFRYLALREQTQRIRHAIGRIDRQLSSKPATRRAGPGVRPAVRAPRRRRLAQYDRTGSRLWRAVADAQSFQAQLAEFVTPEAPAGQDNLLRDALGEVLEECTLLNAATGAGEGGKRAVILIRLGQDSDVLLGSWRPYESVFEKRFGGAKVAEVEAAKRPGLLGAEWRALLADLPGAYGLFRREEGTHLFLMSNRILPVQVWVLPLGEEDEVMTTISAFMDRRKRWRAAGGGEENDPWRHLPVVRVYDENSATADLRSGLVAQGMPTAEDLRRFILASLALPEEFEEASTEPSRLD
jgi:ATP-dependent Clp protease ATP-binding subunit ClpA